MQNAPSSVELLSAISQFLKTRIAPQLSGHDAYSMKVSLNALALVQRDLEHRNTAEAEERHRLKALLSADGDLSDLNRQLCEKIRLGELSSKDKTLLDHLRQTTIDQLKVDQPNYSGLSQKDSQT